MRIVFLAAVEFHSCLSGRTRRLAEVLARQGHEVTFVEMPSLRATVRSFLGVGRQSSGIPGIRIVRLPPSPGLMRLQRSRLVQSLKRLVHKLHESLVICSTPWWSPILQDLPRRRLCYDCIDDYRVHAGPSGRSASVFASWETQLIQQSDIVSVVSEPLAATVQEMAPEKSVCLVPNAVGGEWFTEPPAPVSRARLTNRPDQPIVGFVGALFEWVDLELLHHTAAALPEHQFAFIGPRRRGVSVQALAKLPNVRFHGPQPYEEVRRWMAALDVGLIPFKKDRISVAADPIKLYEYAALGKPIVSTIDYRVGSERTPIIHASSREEFVLGIQEACLADSADTQRERRVFAQCHTWEHRAATLMSAIGSCVQQHPSTRVQTLTTHKRAA